MPTKWFLRARLLWSWVLGVLVVLAGLDAFTLDALLPHLSTLFGLDPALVAMIRAKALAAAALAALILAIWRARRPDKRPLTLLPRKPGGLPVVLLALASASGGIGCASLCPAGLSPVSWIEPETGRIGFECVPTRAANRAPRAPDSSEGEAPPF